MLYTGVWGFICLVPKFHYCTRPMRFGSRGPSEFSRPSRSSRVRHQNALSKKAWEGRHTGTRLGLGKGSKGFISVGTRWGTEHFTFEGGGAGRGWLISEKNVLQTDFDGKKCIIRGKKSYTVVCQEKNSITRGLGKNKRDIHGAHSSEALDGPG